MADHDKKERILDNPAEVEKALGIRPRDRLAKQESTGGDSKTVVTTPKTDVRPGFVSLGQKEFSSKPEETATTEPGKPDDTQKQDLTPEQRAKMFQQRFSQEQTARMELEKQLELQKQQLDFMKSFVEGVQYSQMTQQPARQSAKEEVELSEPKITDFIPDYDESEGVSTTDPRYHKYLAASLKHERDILKKDVLSDLKREQRLSRIIENGKKFCSVYPEYKLPNGEPNWVKIKQDLGELAETGDFIRAKKFIEFESGNAQQEKSEVSQNNQTRTATILDQVESIANQQKIPSVSDTGQVSDIQEDTSEISDEAQVLKRMFGRV